MLDIGLKSMISSPGHHHYFLTDFSIRAELLRARDYIRGQGLRSYVQREYPSRGEKRIIVNRIAGRYYVVDGNKHLAAMLLAEPGLCAGELERIAPGLFRIWNCGIEDTARQYTPYEVYIPMRVDTSGIRGVRTGWDHFKAVPEATKIIPADVPFDSPQFSEIDRGRPLSELVEEFRRICA